MERPDPRNEEAREAEAMGEKSDLGARADALIEALDGTDSGSDTRAGSLEGGAATGSDDDPDQDAVNADLARKGSDLKRNEDAQPAKSDD